MDSLAPHLALGRAGETAAEAHVRGLGWRVLARNWRDGSLELDLVCLDGDALVFVEVKTRGAGSLGEPADGLSRTKAGRLARAAMRYLSRTDGWDRPCRFDLAAVTPVSGGLKVELIHDVLDVASALGGGHAAWQPW